MHVRRKGGERRGREGQVGSHRYNRVRRERISRGSLTFPFAGPRDALGNRVIRLGLSYTRWPAASFSFSYSRPLRVSLCTSEGITAPRSAHDFVEQNRLFRVLHRRLHLAFVNVAQKGVATTTARASSWSRPYIAITVRRSPHIYISRRYRGNFVQTQIIHCRCSRKLLSGGIRNYMLN